MTLEVVVSELSADFKDWVLQSIMF